MTMLYPNPCYNEVCYIGTELKFIYILTPFWRPRGGSRISGKGVHMYKTVGVRFADFISFS